LFAEAGVPDEELLAEEVERISRMLGRPGPMSVQTG
jgi:hypothetical protein